MRGAYQYPLSLPIKSAISLSLLVPVNDVLVYCLDVLSGPGGLAPPAPDLHGVGSK